MSGTWGLAKIEDAIAQHWQMAKRQQVDRHPPRVSALKLDRGKTGRHSEASAPYCSLHRNTHLRRIVRHRGPEPFADPNLPDRLTVNKHVERHPLPDMTRMSIKAKFHGIHT